MHCNWTWNWKANYLAKWRQA